MLLAMHNGIIYSPGKRGHDVVSTQRAARLLADIGYRPAVAQAVACGALVKMPDVLAVARMAGLVAGVDTVEAKQKGLVQ